MIPSEIIFPPHLSLWLYYGSTFIPSQFNRCFSIKSRDTKSVGKMNNLWSLLCDFKITAFPITGGFQGGFKDSDNFVLSQENWTLLHIPLSWLGNPREKCGSYRWAELNEVSVEQEGADPQSFTHPGGEESSAWSCGVMGQCSGPASRHAFITVPLLVICNINLHNLIKRNSPAYP